MTEHTFPTNNCVLVSLGGFNDPARPVARLLVAIWITFSISSFVGVPPTPVPATLPIPVPVPPPFPNPGPIPAPLPFPTENPNVAPLVVDPVKFGTNGLIVSTLPSPPAVPGLESDALVPAVPGLESGFDDDGVLIPVVVV